MSLLARLRSALESVTAPILGGTPLDALRDAVAEDPYGAAQWITDLHRDRAEALLFAEKLIRSSVASERMIGADLKQILKGLE